MLTEIDDLDRSKHEELEMIMDPDRMSAILAEAHRMRAEVVHRLLHSLFCLPGQALSSVVAHVRHVIPGRRPNYS